MGKLGSANRHLENFTADVALTKGYGFVGSAANAGGAKLPGAGDRTIGVVDGNDAAVGEAFAGCVGGKCIAIADDAISLGDEVEVTAAGKFIPLNTGIAVGQALEAAAADGDEFELHLY